jgi:hypothetical protein
MTSSFCARCVLEMALLVRHEPFVTADRGDQALITCAALAQTNAQDNVYIGRKRAVVRSSNHSAQNSADQSSRSRERASKGSNVTDPPCRPYQGCRGY